MPVTVGVSSASARSTTASLTETGWTMVTCIQLGMVWTSGIRSEICRTISKLVAAEPMTMAARNVSVEAVDAAKGLLHLQPGHEVLGQVLPGGCQG